MAKPSGCPVEIANQLSRSKLWHMLELLQCVPPAELRNILGYAHEGAILIEDTSQPLPRPPKLVIWDN